MTEKAKTSTAATTPATEKRGKSDTKKNSTVIQKCTCVSEFQDNMYGKGMRVKNSSGTGFKCTVCGAK